MKLSGAGDKSALNNIFERHPKTWHELGVMQRGRPDVAEFGKENCS
jgi:hypothetical protein